MSSFWERHEYRTSRDGLMKRGFVYQGQHSRVIGNGGTASAQFVTGDVPTVVYIREVTSTAAPVAYRLWETTATSGASGSAVGQNLNRTISGSGSVSQAVISASVTAASVTNLLGSDVVGGAGGKAICSKARTLAPNSTYLLQWENLGTTTTTVQATLVWSENEPDPYGTIQ
jgi:hypothetical protein